MTKRNGKTAEGSHEYALENGMHAVRMGNGEWYIFAGNRDIGVDFKTLRECRRWARENNNA
jgi:hypothetical protein